MKLKFKTSFLLLILPLLFFVLHYFVYLGHYQSPFDGNEALPDWFILVSPAPEPLSLHAITLTKTVRPDYLHPFRNFEYHYSEKNSTDTVIVEKRQFLSTEMMLVKGDRTRYFNEKIDGPFYRGFGVIEYPNVLFFVVQYAIMIGFVVIVFRKLQKNLT